MAGSYTNGGGDDSIGTAVLTKLIDDKVGNKQSRTLMHIVNLFQNNINDRFDKVDAEFAKVYAELKKVTERVDKFEKNTNNQFAELKSRLDKFTLHFRYQMIMIGVLLSVIIADGDLVQALIFKLFGR